MPLHIDPHPFDLAEHASDIFIVGLHRNRPEGLAHQLLTWLDGPRLGLTDTPVGCSLVHERYVVNGPDPFLTARTRLAPHNINSPLAVIYCVTNADGLDPADSSEVFPLYDQAYHYVRGYTHELRRAGANPYLLRVAIEAFAIDTIGLDALIRNTRGWLGELPVNATLYLDGTFRPPSLEHPYGSQWALPSQ